jgi:Mrp family chromosome partitioning ATPase
LDRTELEAFKGLSRSLDGSPVVLATGYDGKSTVALGLAAAAVAEGRATILVECDLARPTLAASLGLEETPGLAEYLRYEAEAAEILQTVVMAGPAAGRAVAPLVCIVGGAPTSHGPTLLAAESLRHVVSKLRNAYELVIVDGPPFDDEHSLRAVAAQVKKTLACCLESEVPKGLRADIDGLVVPAVAG